MTERGKNNPPPREVSPADPSLESNPVPRIQDLATYPMGPAAASDADSSFSTTQEPMEAHQPPHDDIFQFIVDLDGHSIDLCPPGRREERNRTAEEELALTEAIRDRTWGFYVFVVDYEAQSQSLLPSALEKLAKCVHLSIQRYTTEGTSPQVAEELWKRFRLEVVQDPSKLSGASLDRVRASFIALLRARRPDFSDYRTRPPMGPKSKLCLVLDAEAIQTIANLDVPDTYSEAVDHIYKSLDVRVLKAVDSEWERPKSSHSSYRGVYITSPVDLHYLFSRIGWIGSHELQQLHQNEQTLPWIR